MTEADNNTQGQKPKTTPLRLLVISAITIIVVLLIAFVDWRPYVRGYPPEAILCPSNLNALGLAILSYMNDNDGNAPTADKWCDLLTKYTDVGEKSFRCPCVKDGRCHFAINPNFYGELSSFDMVVLFETKAGWNQHGGAEIMSCDRHKSGCLVMFANTHVEYVKPDQLDQLKWKDEQKQ